MIAHIVYPMPFDNWNVFETDFYRFIYTFKLYPPECDYLLHVVCNYGLVNERLAETLWNTKACYHTYFEGGADLGSHKRVAVSLPPQAFLIGLSTRCYFHRPGWGRRLVEAREKHGPGMYGVGDFERTPHLRTCGYGIDAGYWQSYPVTPTTRPETVEIESGDYSLTEHVKQDGGKTIQVCWDNEQEQDKWRDPTELGLFRRGNQNAVLVWDRHTEIFQASSPEERARLEALSNPH